MLSTPLKSALFQLYTYTSVFARLWNLYMWLHSWTWCLLGFTVAMWQGAKQRLKPLKVFFVPMLLRLAQRNLGYSPHLLSRCPTACQILGREGGHFLTITVCNSLKVSDPPLMYWFLNIIIMWISFSICVWNMWCSLANGPSNYMLVHVFNCRKLLFYL